MFVRILGKNKLIALPNVFDELGELSVLDLSSNMLTWLPKSLNRAVKISKL